MIELGFFLKTTLLFFFFKLSNKFISPKSQNSFSCRVAKAQTYH